MVDWLMSRMGGHSAALLGANLSCHELRMESASVTCSLVMLSGGSHMTLATNSHSVLHVDDDDGERTG